MSDETPITGHPSAHRPRQDPNKPPSPAERGPYSATYPMEVSASFDVIPLGPDIGTEADYRLLGDVSGRRIMVLGAGGGHAAVAMAAQGAHVIVVDNDADRLTNVRDAAEQHELKVELHHTDLADLAFMRSESADAVYSAYALATLDDLPRAFRQIHRVLRTDKPLVASFPHPAFGLIDPAAIDPMRIRRTYWDESPKPWEIDGRSGQEHLHTVSVLFTLLARAGLAVDTILEPEPPTEGPHSPWHTEIMRWIPATLVLRARKLGS